MTIVTNLQHACPIDEQNEYIDFMKKECNVDILFDRAGDFCDELSIEGEFDNVKKAVHLFYGHDTSQVQYICPQFL